MGVVYIDTVERHLNHFLNSKISEKEKTMNTTKLYAMLKENEDNFKNADNYYLSKFYEEAFAMVKEDIAKQAEKSAGRKANVRNAVKKFLSYDNARPILQKAQVMDIDGVTYYGYCDGFKLAWSPIDFGFDKATPEESIKFDKIINVQYRGEKGTVPVTKEFRTALKMAIKTNTDRYRGARFEIDCGDGHTVLVNAKYLEACLDFTEADEIIVDMGYDGAPIIMHGKEDRNALLLPIRK